MFAVFRRDTPAVGFGDEFAIRQTQTGTCFSLILGIKAVEDSRQVSFRYANSFVLDSQLDPKA